MSDRKPEQYLPSETPEEVVPLVEEDLHVSKRQVVTGRVRVRTLIDTVEEVAREALRSETVEVTRVPVGREVTRGPGRAH